jgi:hypothetical protein
LRRIEAGGFTEADALALDALDPTAIRPLEDIVAPLMRLELDEQQTRAVVDGKPIAAPSGVEEDSQRALFSNGRLLAVYRRAGDVLKAETVVGDLATRR